MTISLESGFPKPAVAFVVVNWNGWRDTLDCLDSLLRLAYPRYDVVVVDNGSTDDSVERIRAWIGAVPETAGDTRVTLLRSADNRGFAGGNNIGIRWALTEGHPLVCLLNNDTVVDPEFLPRLVDTLESHPEWMVVGPKILYRDDPTRIWYAGGRINLWLAYAGHPGMGTQDGGQWSGERVTDCVSGCCFLARAEIFRTVGLLDEEYFFAHEDAAYACLLRNRGFRLGVNLDARIYHKSAGSIGTTSLRYEYFAAKHRLLTLKKHGTLWERLVGFFLFGVSRPPKFLALVLAGKGRGVLAEATGIRDFLLGRFAGYDRQRAILNRPLAPSDPRQGGAGPPDSRTPGDTPGGRPIVA